MKKTIRLNESQFNEVIHRLIKEQQEKKENPKDLYHPHWNKEDTILTWYCAKYGDVRPLGMGYKRLETENDGYDGLGELSNYVIGTVKHSLLRQISNMRFLDGDITALKDYSKMQEGVYNEYKNVSEEKLRQICLNIIDSRPQSIYDNFIEMWRDKMNMSAANKRAKTEKEKIEKLNKQSEISRDDLLRMALGKKDMSRFKSLGPRPRI